MADELITHIIPNHTLEISAMCRSCLIPSASSTAGTTEKALLEPFRLSEAAWGGDIRGLAHCWPAPISCHIMIDHLRARTMRLQLAIVHAHDERECLCIHTMTYHPAQRRQREIV